MNLRRTLWLHIISAPVVAMQMPLLYLTVYSLEWHLSIIFTTVYLTTSIVVIKRNYTLEMCVKNRFSKPVYLLTGPIFWVGEISLIFWSLLLALAAVFQVNTERYAKGEGYEIRSPGGFLSASMYVLHQNYFFLEKYVGNTYMEDYIHPITGEIIKVVERQDSIFVRVQGERDITLVFIQNER